MDMYELENAYKSGSTHAAMESWQHDQRWNEIKDGISRIEDLYQMLETCDEITEDNPAFHFMCDFTEKFYLALTDLKGVIYNYENDPKYTELVRKYIKSHMSSPYGSSLG